MGEAMDHQMEVMEKMRKRLERESGRWVSLDEIDPDEAWNEEFASWEEDNGSYCEEDDNNVEVGFEVGDTVKLNSSDIAMTIKSIDDNTLTCRWFDKNNNLESAEFNINEVYSEGKKQKENNNSQELFKKESVIPEIDIDEDEMPF